MFPSRNGRVRPLELTAALAVAFFCAAYPAFGEPEDGASPAKVEGSSQEQPTESDMGDPPPRKIATRWNEYDLKFFTLRWGIYALLDWGTAFQSTAATRQIDVRSDLRARDFRFTFKGEFATRRPISYTAGIMYDGPSNLWLPRETGIQIGIPELWGNVFVGRQKEGFSLNKIAVGYAVWVMERMPFNDASVPIMVDGIKWLGVLPSKRANFNVGYFHNFLPRNPTTGWYDNSLAARVAWLPMLPDKEGALLHLAIGYHWGTYSDDEAQLRSRPESFTAPYFLDTGFFPASYNNMVGFEAYYRKGPWLTGAEYAFNQVHSPQTGNPLFHGGEAFVAWAVTGEVRPYHDVGGKLGFLFPNHSAFEGGPGAFEPVLHVSYTDFDSAQVQGGRFWRITPHVNWYLDSMVRLEFNYGLGFLDRFGTTEPHHFIQARLQIQIQ